MFNNVLSADPDRACYGYRDVRLASEQLAIDQLLVTDTLFKSADIGTRKQYVDLVDAVRGCGGVVHVFSSLHVSGIQLNLYTGIAAILRHPMPELGFIDDAAGEMEPEPDLVAGVGVTDSSLTGSAECAVGDSVDRDIFDMDDFDFGSLSL